MKPSSEDDFWPVNGRRGQHSKSPNRPANLPTKCSVGKIGSVLEVAVPFFKQLPYRLPRWMENNHVRNVSKPTTRRQRAAPPIHVLCNLNSRKLSHPLEVRPAYYEIAGPREAMLLNV